jgi:two-component system nitrate/nitrite response regulator NarL
VKQGFLAYFQFLIKKFKALNPVSILLVDDHPIMQDGVKALLATESQLQVKASAKSVSEAEIHLSRASYDLLITDLNLPDQSGLVLIKAARNRYPEMKIIVLSMHDEPHLIRDILKEGVHGYILKSATNDELKKAISKVMDGKRFVSEDISGLLLEDFNSKEKHQLLTEREREIVQLIAKEYSNKQIAEELFISERTVETHRKNIFRKTNTNSVVGLLKFAYNNHLLKQ